MFKRTAVNIVSKLNASLPGKEIVAVYNETAPRRGAFVLKLENNDIPILEMLALKRPFTDLRNLDIDEVVQKIVKIVNK